MIIFQQCSGRPRSSRFCLFLAKKLKIDWLTTSKAELVFLTNNDDYIKMTCIQYLMSRIQGPTKLSRWHLSQCSKIKCDKKVMNGQVSDDGSRKKVLATDLIHSYSFCVSSVCIPVEPCTVLSWWSYEASMTYALVQALKKSRLHSARSASRIQSRIQHEYRL